MKSNITHIKRRLIGVLVVWVALVAASFFWNYEKAKNEQQRILLETARSFFDQIVLTRQWNALHGGVYMQVTEKTQPNVYLDTPFRDIQVNSSLMLTKVNPAFMTRQISEIASEKKGVQFHITSLNPIRPLNQPTALEAKFLKAFEKGLDEKGVFIKKGNEKAFFYMAPLMTTKACLKCHEKQGYKEGDIRGGISVTLPFHGGVPFLPLFWGHFLIGAIGFIGIVFAGTKLDKAYEKIKRHAVFDALTGIANRRSFSETMLREFRRNKREHRPLSVIMCDIDNFKAYNDTYGHSKGDECLKKVAGEMDKVLKRPGDFCARYGGEEFIVILPNTDIDGALEIAEQIRLGIEKLKIAHEKSLPLQWVTLSLGVATMQKNDIFMSHETLVKNADAALYEAKEKGRNQVRSFVHGTLQNKCDV